MNKIGTRTTNQPLNLNFSDEKITEKKVRKLSIVKDTFSKLNLLKCNHIDTEPLINRAEEWCASENEVYHKIGLEVFQGLVLYRHGCDEAAQEAKTGVKSDNQAIKDGSIKILKNLVEIQRYDEITMKAARELFEVNNPTSHNSLNSEVLFKEFFGRNVGGDAAVQQLVQFEYNHPNLTRHDTENFNWYNSRIHNILKNSLLCEQASKWLEGNLNDSDPKLKKIMCKVYNILNQNYEEYSSLHIDFSMKSYFVDSETKDFYGKRVRSIDSWRESIYILKSNDESCDKAREWLNKNVLNNELHPYYEAARDLIGYIS